MNTQHTPTPPVPTHYRVRLQGRINYDWSDWLSEIEVRCEGEGSSCQTIVSGTVRDQSGLFGLLNFIRNLGVVLLSVESVY